VLGVVIFSRHCRADFLVFSVAAISGASTAPIRHRYLLHYCVFFGSRPAGGLLSCRDKKPNAHPVAAPALRAGALRSSLKPGAAQLARIKKADLGSNSARALLRLKLQCSASSDGGTSTATATSGAIRCAHCALRRLG